MISSESSDEEFETLHKQQVAPRKKRRVDAPAASAVKPAAPATAATAADHSADADVAAAADAEAPTPVEEEDPSHVVRPDMSREEKKAIRKKRRLDKREELAKQQDEKSRRETERERALKGRGYTLSIAVPGSIVENAQTKELKSYLAGQIARAAAIYQVDEIVIFDDQLGAARGDGYHKKRANDPHVFMMRILQYLETPQYLRRALFPMHSDLSCAGLLNPLDCPHHLRSDEWSTYREGVVVDRPLKEKEGSHVNVGLQKEVVVDKRIQPGIRVTVKIDETTKDHKKKMLGTLVSSAEPREQVGVYWGYTARFASSFNNVFTECPYKEGYDLKIGTSNLAKTSVNDDGFRVSRHRHALVVFGGLAGIEECVNADETVPVSGDDAASLFDVWVRTCPTDGSRSIRSEEAVLMSLATLRKPLTDSNRQ